MLKLSPLVRERELYLAQEELNFGIISEDDTATIDLKLQNRGILPITVSDIYSTGDFVFTDQHFPFQIRAMSSEICELKFFTTDTGIYSDTLVITSDDPMHPVTKLVVRADVQMFFKDQLMQHIHIQSLRCLAHIRT